MKKLKWIEQGDYWVTCYVTNPNASQYYNLLCLYLAQQAYLNANMFQHAMACSMTARTIEQ